LPILAYLDPVTGSALLQILLGAAAAVGLGWQYLRRWFRSLMSHVKGGESFSPPEDTVPTSVDNPPSDTSLRDVSS
jgi:hypothetical protein